MRLFSIVAVLLAGAGACRGGDLNIHLMLSGEVAPGVYGQVQIGNESPPPLVNAQPILIELQSAPAPPVYLHVPPGHARNWRKHCREYNACNRMVYFVRSKEYELGYVRGNNEHDHDRSHHGDEDHDHHGHDGRDRHDD